MQLKFSFSLLTFFVLVTLVQAKTTPNAKRSGSQSNQSPCDPYWYSMDNPAVTDCRDIIRVMGRMAADTSLVLLTEKTKLSSTDAPVEMILGLDQKFAECVLQTDDKVLPMDEIFLQEKERVYENNKFLTDIVNLCTQTVQTVCPFNPVFNDDDLSKINCIPHPLELLKCIRQVGIPECNVKRTKQEEIKMKEPRSWDSKIKQAASKNKPKKVDRM
ncbi:uncharacterized protein LOC132202155 [Neocloeon triangulifer]|uniref:uncharacterized protein LOC132202155 n=1 Tax=Neocloeon triangulifer TaxID=2078957 RepID=UPI00286F5594|nr:uncharacterized protein LOC132202155 [Neocloeon triangulifer]